MYVYVHGFRCMGTHVGVETRSPVSGDFLNCFFVFCFCFVLVAFLVACLAIWGRGWVFFMLEERSFTEPEHSARLADRSVSFRDLPASLPPPASLHWGYRCVLLHLSSLRGFWGFEPRSLNLAQRALYQLSRLSGPVFCFLCLITALVGSFAQHCITDSHQHEYLQPWLNLYSPILWMLPNSFIQSLFGWA